MQKSAVAQQTRPLFLLYSRTKTLLFVMRVSSFVIVLMILAVNLLRAEDGLGQGIEDKTISLELHNETLRNALNKIEELSGYRVAYVVQEVVDYKNINLEKEKRTVKKTLELILNNTALAFKQEEFTILIYNRGHRRAELVMSDSVDANILAANADTTVRGRVTTAEGGALEGVSVTVQGSDIGTSTNAQGYFALKGVPGNAVLLFSFIGFERQVIRLEGKKNLEVQLVKRGGAVLDEVVVSTGYQKISKERFVGAVTTIDSELYHRQISTDVLSRLDGITNGLLFDHRKGVSGGVSLQIHGISSINSSSYPLIVLDNFPYTGDINNINPDDVDNITILKDAAAASIWGARAGNGVIVITTKKGKYNQPFSVSFSSRVNVTEKPHVFSQPIISSSDFIDLEELLFSNGNRFADTASGSRPVISPVYEILYKLRRGDITQAVADAQINSLRGIDVRNDIDKYINRPTLNQNYSLNIGGGNNIFNYALSGSYNHNSGGRIGLVGPDRYTFNTSSSLKVRKRLELQAGLSFTQTNSKDHGSAFLPKYPYVQLADAMGNPLAIDRGYRSSYLDTAGGGKLLDWNYSPLDELRNGYITNTSKGQFVLMNLSANLKITDWLNGGLQYQYSVQNSESRNLQGLQSYLTRDMINRYTQINGSTVTRIIPLGDILSVSNSNTTGYNLRGQLNINKAWMGKHQLTALAGAEVSQNYNKSNSSLLYAYKDNNLQIATLDYVTYYPLYGGQTGSASIPYGSLLGETIARTASFYGNASYTYLNRYTLYSSARKDGANVFGVKTNNKWKPLWSVGAAWDISKENFYTVSWMPSLKLKVTYGYAGNTNNTISGQATVSNGNISNYTTLNSYLLRTPANPNLRWEQVATLNVGLDFSVLNNKISGSINIYQKKSSDLFESTPLDPTTGWTGATVNSADLKGNGIDFQLNTINIDGAFKWKTSFSFNYARVIVTKYYLPESIFVNSISNFGGGLTINPRPGQLAWGFYSNRWAGLDPATGAPRGYLNKEISTNYAAMLSDSLQNGVFSGSSVPLSYGNILNTFSWKVFKGLSLSANMTFRLDYSFRRAIMNYSIFFNSPDIKNANSEYSRRWQKPGDEAWTTVPSLVYPADANRDGFYANSEATVEKGDYIRLQDVRINYSIDNKNMPRIAIKNIQIFIMGNNLGLLWIANKAGIDPDSQSITPSKSLALGMTANF